MLVDDGDELFSLAIDSGDVAGIFGRVEGPRTLLEVEVMAMLLRHLRRPCHCRGCSPAWFKWPVLPDTSISPTWPMSPVLSGPVLECRQYTSEARTVELPRSRVVAGDRLAPTT